MRSIRRSMTVYLSALLLLTLVTVGLVLDRVTEDALMAREVDGEALIVAQYEERCREERDKIDLSLMNEAKLLSSLMNEQNERATHSARMGSAQLMMSLGNPLLGNPLLEVAWAPTNVMGPISETLYRNYFANLPLPQEYTQHLNETNAGTDYQQINVGRSVVSGEWHSESLAGRKLPFDHEEIDARLPDHGKPGELFVWIYDETTIPPENEAVHRIILKVPRLRNGGLLGPRGSGGGNVPRSMLGTWTSWSLAGFPNPVPPGMASLRPERSPQPTGDNLPRLYIQCARPKSIIDTALTRFAEERDEAREKLADDVQYARNKMRLQTVVVSMIALFAVAIGGYMVVGAGLRPVGKLSDAVSRVSEKDFKLPHDGLNLAQELAPIHSRLTQTLDMLQRAFTREKQAVADISHELRTPIAALMATIDVALRKQRTPDQYREKLQECREISKQLGQLVERIMKLATLDAGNDRTVISRTDAFDLCAGSAAIIRPLAEQNGVTVHLHLPEDMVELDTDPDKLREVLMNLLHNAVEYNRSEGRIDFTLRRESSQAVFEIRDTGIGMTTEIKEKIFERFFRADPSRHATGVHAGLGLAIVKEYISRLNGVIEVESEPEKGSTFRITLPALPSEEVPQISSDEPVAAGS